MIPATTTDEYIGTAAPYDNEFFQNHLHTILHVFSDLTQSLLYISDGSFESQAIFLCCCCFSLHATT